MDLPLQIAPEKARALNVYKNSKVETASPGKLVLMMYDAALRNMKQAENSIAQKNISATNAFLIKAQDIVDELRASLNSEAGELSQRMGSIYDYVYYCLIAANLKKQPETLRDAMAVLGELRDGWEEVVSKHG
jgi:flagellar protein FliS